MTEETTSGDSGKLLYCSFCGKSQNEVRKLIAGPSVFICDECVDLCNDIIREEIQESSSEDGSTKLPIPAEINEILNQYVIGQEKAKRVLAVAVYNHYKRLRNATPVWHSASAYSDCRPPPPTRAWPFLGQSHIDSVFR